MGLALSLIAQLYGVEKEVRDYLVEIEAEVMPRIPEGPGLSSTV